ncbi:MAG: hypothetical protein QXF26_01810 [Candidatus Bathyarchaeia archaeon]
MEEFTVYDDGKVLYRDLKSGIETEVDLDEELSSLVRHLHEELSKASQVKIKAKSGAADFFTYKLNVAGKDFEWVDEWAADESLPEYLVDFYKLTSAVINDKIKKSFTNYGAVVYNENMSLGVELENYFYHVDEPITIRVLAKNTGDSDISYISPTPCHPDFLLNSDIEHELEFTKPKFSKDTICIQVIDMRQLEAGTLLENLAVITFKKSGIAHITVRFPPTTFEREILVVTVPIFISD